MYVVPAIETRDYVTLYKHVVCVENQDRWREKAMRHQTALASDIVGLIRGNPVDESAIEAHQRFFGRQA